MSDDAKKALEEAMQSDPWVAALMTEREGYLRRDLPDRAKEVENEIRRHMRSKTSKPEGRSTGSKQTA